MVVQLPENLPFMDVYGIHLALRCLAKLGHPVPPELLSVCKAWPMTNAVLSCEGYVRGLSPGPKEQGALNSALRAS